MTHARKTLLTRLAIGGTGVALVAALALVALFAFSTSAHAATKPNMKLTPRFDPTSIRHHAAAAAKTSASSLVTVPLWNSAFTYNSLLYPFSMVGTDPAKGSATTHIEVVIVPIDLTFTGGVHYNGDTKVASTVASPLFNDAYYNSGHTQYVDALQNAEFFNYTKNKNYHVLLEKPIVQAPVQWTVPSSASALYQVPSGPSFAVVDINWWYPQVLGLLSSRHLSAKVLPIFLTYNTLLSQGDPTNLNNCCIIGYHDAVGSAGANGRTNVNTYAWASWTDSGIFTVAIDDVNALSHELAEWANDPLTTNTVPVWSVPSQPQYGCSNALEVGDPLVGVTSYINGYHLQDEALYSWFARQSPSLAIDQEYSMFGTFDAPASSTGC